MDINIHEFMEQFNKEYAFLYANGDKVAGYDEAVKAFDEFLKSHKDFVLEFNAYRKDIISSDREAGAFMFALEVLSQKQEEKELDKMALDRQSLGHVATDKELHICGYVLNRVLVQKHAGAPVRKYKIYRNTKGFYFVCNGRRQYLPVV